MDQAALVFLYHSPMIWLPVILAAGLVSAQAPAASNALAEVDRLYFHRNQAKNLEDSISLLETQLKAAPDQLIGDMLGLIEKKRFAASAKSESSP